MFNCRDCVVIICCIEYIYIRRGAAIYTNSGCFGIVRNISSV